MATLGLLSDMHYEHRSPSQIREVHEALDLVGLDILVLAGDICTPQYHTELAARLAWFADRVADVVYVPGNHEYWGKDPGTFEHKCLRPAASIKNVHVLDNRAATIKGLRFVGGTLWYPEPRGVLYAMRTAFGDYCNIEGFEPWVYHKHLDFLDLLTRETADKAQLPDVVVTHHMPSSLCVAPRFKVGPWSQWNHFFCHDLTDLIYEDGPQAWLFGHTHDRRQEVIGLTRLYSNPLGYPGEKGDNAERGTWAAPLRIEVTPRG